MGMHLAPTSESYGPGENYDWLGSRHGTDIMDPITLDGAAFLAIFTDGVVPGGTVVGLYTGGASAGKYGPYDDAGTDGLATAAGHLGTTTDVTTDGLDTPAPLFWHGEVVAAKLKANNGLTTAARADLPLIRYV
jgi:hypothetical protein